MTPWFRVLVQQPDGRCVLYGEAERIVEETAALGAPDEDSRRQAAQTARRAFRFDVRNGHIAAYAREQGEPLRPEDIDWTNYPLAAGATYVVGKPEFVGSFPVRTELSVQPRTESTPAETEFEEHGSIALRVFTPITSTEDNTLGRDVEMVVGGSVLVRAKAGGFWTVPLNRDRSGWYVHLNTLGAGGGRKVRVVFCPNRERYVTRELV